jgi:NAD(P)-dependent dehydrogenase (short-subunit alcohol dehydrogenase family)
MEPRTCLVTGAGRGIGASVVRRLTGQGHRVALVARSEAALTRLAEEAPDRCLVLPADVTAPGSAEAVFGRVEAEWGPVEALVLNAGGTRSAPLVKTTDEDWAATLELNLTSPFRWLRRALPPMVERGRGRVVVVASVAARRGEPYVAAYSAAKHGVLGLVRSAAAELATTGVTVNAVCPGYVDTQMTTANIASISARTGRSVEEVERLLATRQPHGRFVTPGEVADAVLFCLSAASLNGQGINVDGGAVQS